MKKPLAICQIGKNGLTEGTVDCIKNAFKDRENVKIAVLKSAGHERENVKKMAEQLVEKLGRNFTYNIIGFTIALKKWRKPMR